MRPAICRICNKSVLLDDVPDEGSWLEFADYREQEKDSLTHPKGLEYFCSEHIEFARSFTSKTSEEALVQMLSKSDDSATSGRTPHMVHKSWWRRMISKLKDL